MRRLESHLKDGVLCTPERYIRLDGTMSRKTSPVPPPPPASVPAAPEDCQVSSCRAQVVVSKRQTGTSQNELP